MVTIDLVSSKRPLVLIISRSNERLVDELNG